MPECEASAFCVADRVASIDTDKRGSVLYIGVVQGYEGEWLGIDWDDPDGGKHAGTVAGVQYFRAKHEHSGSFVRPWKVTGGVDIVTAVKKKYGTFDASEVYGLTMGSRTIDMVGMESLHRKQAQLSELRRVLLSGCNVNGASGDHLSVECPNVVELDLCNNLLARWDDVLAICVNLVKLRALDLSRNYLLPLSEKWAKNAVLSQLKSLFLNYSGLNWTSVSNCVALCPNILDLGLCGNCITTITVDPIRLFSCLQSLDLENNPIASWDEVLKFGALQTLQVLNLNNCRLSHVSFDGSQSSFPCLKALYLSRNEISEWSCVDELNKLPALRQLLFADNPVRLSHSPETSRQLIIAKVAHLESLDRQQIDRCERRGAEQDYLKRFGLQWQQSGLAAGDGSEDIKTAAATQFQREHPRYTELIKRLGPPDVFESVTTGSTQGVLKNCLLDLKFVFDDATYSSVSRKVPNTMTVAKLKVMVARLIRRDQRTISLSYESAKQPGIKFPLDKDTRDLSYYAVASSDIVHVQC